MKKITVSLVGNEKQEIYTYFYSCNNCNYDDIVVSANYCPYCGNEIVWKISGDELETRIYLRIELQKSRDSEGGIV